MIKVQLNKGVTGNQFQIKFSGDGARVSKISNVVISSVAILINEINVSLQSVKHSSSFFDQLSKLSETKQITVDEKEIEIDLCVGGDMKFLRILLGLGDSTGDFACPWCKIHKQNRNDVTNEWNFYHSAEFFRSTQEISELAGLSKYKFGVKHKPLLMVPLDHFIPDELPLMLRITDILLINLILDFKDTDDHLNKNVNIPANVEFVCGLVQSCGVTFYICTPKGSSELEWTSLSGNETTKILKLLLEKHV